MVSLKISALFFFAIVYTTQCADNENDRINKLEERVGNLLTDAERFRQVIIFWRSKFIKLEKRLKTLEATKWTLHRKYYEFPSLQFTVLHPDATATKGFPFAIPHNTRALLIGIKMEQWKEAASGSATLTLKFHQTGNVASEETTLTAPMNDFYYEIMVPWDSRYGNTLDIITKGTSKNIYSLSLVGYITG